MTGIPRGNTALLAWATNFIAQVQQPAPTDWGLTTGLCTSYQGLLDTYQTNLGAADPAIRNKQATADKDSSKQNLIDESSRLILLINATSTVTDGMKLAAGITVRATPTNVPIPATVPSLDIVSVNGRIVRVRLHDSTGEGSRRKPPQVKGATIVSFVGDSAALDPAQWTLCGTTTKSIIDVPFDSTLAAGTTVWISAMWVNEKLQAGNACPPQSVVFGSALGEAA